MQNDNAYVMFYIYVFFSYTLVIKIFKLAVGTRGDQQGRIYYCNITVIGITYVEPLQVATPWKQPSYQPL